MQVRSIVLSLIALTFLNCGGSSSTTTELKTPDVIDETLVSNNYEWVVLYGSDAFDIAQASAMSSQGYAYIGGITNGNIALSNPDESFDLFISKFEGNKLIKTLQTDTNFNGNSLKDIAIDEEGSVYITGGVGHASGTSMYLKKFNSNLDELWSKTYGSTYSAEGVGIAIDSNNNIISTGNDNSTITLNKVDKDGTFIWMTQIGTIQDDLVTGIVVDSEDNIYLTGLSNGEFIYDEKTSPSGTYDVFLIKYDKWGSLLWIKQFGTESAETSKATAITIDKGDNIYVTGWTRGSLDGISALGNLDAFLIRFDTNGKRVWTKQFASKEHEIATDVEVDSDGFIYVSGKTEDTNSETIPLDNDAYVTQFSADGLLEWTQYFGVHESQGVSGQEHDSKLMIYNKDIYLSGNTSGDFGFVNKGVDDVYFLKIKVK